MIRASLSLSYRANPSPNSAGVELSPSSGHVQAPLVDILTTSHRSVTSSEDQIVAFCLKQEGSFQLCVGAKDTERNLARRAIYMTLPNESSNDRAGAIQPA